MKIWYVNQYAIPPGEPGGTRHYSLCKGLIARGHEATIVAGNLLHVTRTAHGKNPSRVGKGAVDGAKIASEEIHDGVRFLWIPTPPYSDNGFRRLWSMLRFASQVRRLATRAIAERPDLIIGSSPHLFAASAASALAANLKIPFASEIRDLWPQSLIDLGIVSSRHPMTWLLERLERRLYRRSRAILTLLPDSAPHLIAKGADPNTIHWLPNGVDLDLAGPPRPLPANEAFTVVYTGAHGVPNSLETLVDAAAILARKSPRRFRFRLIGEGTEKERLRKRAIESGAVNLTLEGATSKREIYFRLAEADACVVLVPDSPLYRFGISANKFFDYLAAGRPIVAASSASNDIVRQAQAGITIPPANPPLLAEAFEQMAALPWQERQAMGHRGRAYVEKHHSFETLAARLEQIALDLCDETPHARRAA